MNDSNYVREGVVNSSVSQIFTDMHRIIFAPNDVIWEHRDHFILAFSQLKIIHTVCMRIIATRTHSGHYRVII